MTLSASNAETTMLTRMRTSTAFTTDVPKSPISNPINVTASVAAPCGAVSTNIAARLVRLNPGSDPASQHATALPPSAATQIRAARPSVSPLKSPTGRAAGRSTRRKWG
jgi:hypothetical protein